jgi:3-carboxy-cis,cis-muconate cycloisomerase
MTFSALDSQLTSRLFASEGMAGVFSDQARLAAMLRVEAALARAQASLGIVPDELAAAIAALDPASLDTDMLGRQTAVAGVPTIPFVKAVQGRLAPELERAFHKGATTQDVIDTALVLQIREALDLVDRDLAAILEGLSRLADAHRATPCAGRTYGQHAAPVTFGFKVAGWLSGISDAAAQLPRLRARVLVASLGGPVGTLAGMGDDGPEVLAAFARELRLGVTPMAWHTLRGRVAETGTWIAIQIGALAKMATDVVQLATTEVAEVSEPPIPGRGGSTAMPHKRNPVSSTIILAAHAVAKGHAASLIDAMAAAHERPAGAWHGEWHAVSSLFGLASGALREARTLATGLVVDAGRMRRNLDATAGLLFADAAAARLAGPLGREEAHRVVEHAAEVVRDTGLNLQAVLDRLTPHPTSEAFDLEPAVRAAEPWIDRAIAAAAEVRNSLARER